MRWAEARFESLYATPSRNGVYKPKEFHGRGCRIVNMGELFGYDFISNQEMNRIDLTAAELRISALADGDLLFGRRSLVEAGAGKCSLVVGPTEPTTFESSVIRVRVNAKVANPRFLYYFFRSPQGRGRVSSIVSGTNVKGIRGSDLRLLLVPTPKKDLQDHIAGVLAAYDDLIENNRRRMVLLEESARLLYQEWFVHLRFPGHERTRSVDGLPEGWEHGVLGDHCSEIRDSVSPEAVDPGTAYIGLEHLPRRSIALNDWGAATQVTSSKHRFFEGDILFGKIRPYFHKVGVAFVDGVASSDAIVIRPKQERLHSLVLMTVASDPFVAATAQQMKEGSKMPRADWKQMQQYPLPLPADALLAEFNDAIRPIIRQLKILSLASRKLRSARDLLLPRLMSGEITI